MPFKNVCIQTGQEKNSIQPTKANVLLRELSSAYVLKQGLVNDLSLHTDKTNNSMKETTCGTTLNRN